MNIIFINVKDTFFKQSRPLSCLYLFLFFSFLNPKKDFQDFIDLKTTNLLTNRSV